MTPNKLVSQVGHEPTLFLSFEESTSTIAPLGHGARSRIRTYKPFKVAGLNKVLTLFSPAAYTSSAIPAHMVVPGRIELPTRPYQGRVIPLNYGTMI